MDIEDARAVIIAALAASGAPDPVGFLVQYEAELRNVKPGRCCQRRGEWARTVTPPSSDGR